MSEKNKVIDIKDRSGISTSPMPGSEKAYVTGSRDDIQVPFRKINLVDTPNRDPSFPGEPNKPIFIYDTAGIYTDPKATIDLQKGLPAIRQAWIDGRADSIELAEYSPEYTKQQATHYMERCDSE